MFSWCCAAEASASVDEEELSISTLLKPSGDLGPNELEKQEQDEELDLSCLPFTARRALFEVGTSTPLKPSGDLGADELEEQDQEEVLDEVCS